MARSMNPIAHGAAIAEVLDLFNQAQGLKFNPTETAAE